MSWFVSWLISVILPLAKPYFGQIVVALLEELEKDFPGATAIIQEVINLIQGGAPVAQLQNHVDNFSSVAAPFDTKS
jgi:hypothetical protein